MKKSLFVKLRFIFFICLVVAFFVLSLGPLAFVFSDLVRMKIYILSWGDVAYLGFILISALQVILAPIPGQITGFLGGYLFGVFYGTLLSLIGLLIGSWVVFVFSRYLGRPYVEEFVKKKRMDKFDEITKEHGKFALFMLFLIPGLPDDVICYFAGLTNIKIKHLLLISLVGRVPSFFISSLIGAGFGSEDYLVSGIVAMVVLVLSAALLVYRKVFQNWMFKAYKWVIDYFGF